MSQSTARKARQTAKANGQVRRPTFRPLKAIVQLHGVYCDEDGNVLGEAALDPFPLAPTAFKDLDTLVKESWPEVEARFLAQQNGNG